MLPRNIDLTTNRLFGKRVSFLKNLQVNLRIPDTRLPWHELEERWEELLNMTCHRCGVPIYKLPWNNSWLSLCDSCYRDLKEGYDAITHKDLVASWGETMKDRSREIFGE